MTNWKAPLLVPISCLATLVLCEIALRWFTQYGSPQPSLAKAQSAAAPKPVDVAAAMRYVERLPVATGAERSWFTDAPPPLPNRGTASTAVKERYEDFVRRGLYAPQAYYVWNSKYLGSNACGPLGAFKQYPPTVMEYEAPTASPHPPYRFPGDSTLPSGLVTNHFGMRGPPIRLAKPPKTIRVAFAGASTTVNSQMFALSYPEWVVYWLNRFAAARRYDVRFEVINSGREGINSQDIAAIVRDEVVPLDPDLVVYYEGSNQFASANAMVRPHVEPRSQIDDSAANSAHKIPPAIRNHLAIGNLLDMALMGFVSPGEPPKPLYHLTWPLGVDEARPDVRNPRLPMALPVILGDLDTMREALRPISGRLVLASFKWLASDRLTLSAATHRFIYQQLNTVLWPLRYVDIRRLADFQNRVLQRYAIDRRIDFIDVAGKIPDDPDLFVDAIHMTEVGERLKAWIVFQQLVPLLTDAIDRGELPRPGPSHGVPAFPFSRIDEVPVQCGSRTTAAAYRP